MHHGLQGRAGLGIGKQVVSGLGIAVEAGKVARADFQPDTMPRLEDVAGGAQINRVFIDLAGFQQARIGARFAVARADYSVGKIARVAVGLDIHGAWQ